MRELIHVQLCRPPESASRTTQSRQLDGFVVPLTDEHMSEYVGSYAQRLAWLTGFQGSAGSAVVLPEEAAIFVDGRYTLQVRQQVSPTEWSYQSVPETSTTDWLKEHAPEGARIGYDPWLHTSDWVKKAKEALASRGAELVRSAQPHRRIWADRPEASKAKLVVQADEYAGKSAAEKRTEIGDWLTSTMPTQRCCPLSIRSPGRSTSAGRTSPTPPSRCLRAGPRRRHCRPVCRFGEDRARCREASWQWRAASRTFRIRKCAQRADGQDSRRRPRACRRRNLRRFGARGREDPAAARSCGSSESRQKFRGDCRSKSRAGTRRDRDRALSPLDRRGSAPTGEVDELLASDKLEAIAARIAALRDLSFDSISGAGPNGAIVHYKSSEKSNRKLEKGSLYLIDSGGQYVDGTTDITRTVPIGEPTDEMRDRFTRVLKGHIAIATAVFPKGTRGSQLDSFARRPLWEAGLDYAHGTGHEVGSFLSVHEGPQRISPVGSSQSGGDEPLLPGMILSNEPGYYKTGEYGIRIENLVLVVEREIEGAEKEMLGFETLTFAPVDRRLVAAEMLEPEELIWLNCYHAHVLAKIGPRLSGPDLAWLQRACAPIEPTA